MWKTRSQLLVRIAPWTRVEADDAVTHDRGQAASLLSDAFGGSVTSLCDYREFTASAK